MHSMAHAAQRHLSVSMHQNVTECRMDPFFGSTYIAIVLSKTIRSVVLSGSCSSMKKF